MSEELESIPSLKENLSGLETWLASRSFVGFRTAREAEIVSINEQLAYTTATWDEVVALRAARDNIVTILSSFEETRNSLNEKIEELLEKEENLAATERTNENDDIE